MATLTALSLLIGSAALAGTATLAGNMENAPPEPDQVVPEVPKEQPVTAAPAPSIPIEEPVNTATAPSLPIEQPSENRATAPTLPAQPGDEMAGGAIGRPPWGQISSNVVAPQVPGATVSSVLGIKENPIQLKNELIALERQIENANFEVYQLNDKIAEVNKYYTAERTKFIAELSKSKQAETTAGIYQKKLSNQGQQKSNKDPAVKELQTQIDRAPAGSDERKRLQAEKDAMTQAKPASDAEIEAWTKKFSEATAEKVAADDDKAEAERKKNKFGAQLTELRTKQDEQEKLVKELIQKRAVLLGRLKTVLNENVRKEPPPADWQLRTARFARADKARLEAERRLKQFYSDTWLPLQGQDSQKQYQEQLNSLTVLWKNAKAELELARAALTASPQDSITSAGSDFRSFVVEVNDITRNATNRNGTIRDEWMWRNGTMRGYPQSVMILKSYAVKPKIVAAADVYYEIAKMDSPALVRNAPRFIEYFDRVIGSILRPAESEKRPIPAIGRDITKIVLKEFITNVLANAANDVRLYPGVVAEEDIQAKAYADLREKTNTFVDAQIYFINKMFKNIKQARKDSKLSTINGKNMLDLETKARIIYPILDGVPAMGQCARIFKPSTLEMLRSGKRNGKDILTEVLETPTLKDEFLKEIGFVKVSSFLEARTFGKQAGINPADAIELIKKAAFEEYTKNAERLAFEDPEGRSYVRAGGDWDFLNAQNDLRRLTTYGLDTILPLPRPEVGRQLPNKIRAQQLRAEADLHPFVPGVFLESNRIAPGPTAGRVTSLEPISEFRNACELDGNVGSGKEEADRIIAILDKLRDMEIELKEKPSQLLSLIDKLTKINKINIRRPDQAEPISALNQKGFGPPVDSWLIMKVATQDKKLNFIQTFLTFRSSLFRTIPYDDTVVNNGKTMNTREVYSNLVFDEIQKMPSFDVRTDAQKASFPSDEDWGRLSNDFNLNFVIYSDDNGVGRVDLRAAGRPNTHVFYIFKEKNNRYFPVRMNPGPVVAPGLPRGQPGSDFTTFNRGILGGAIDGIRISIPKDEAIETSKKSPYIQKEKEPDEPSIISQAASAFDKWTESFTIISDDTFVLPKIQKKIQKIIERNNQTKYFRVSKYGIDAANYKTNKVAEIEKWASNRTLITYYIKNNRFEIKKHETLFGITDKTLRYVLEVCGAIMEVKIDNNIPTFILHTNNTPGFVIFDNCRLVGGPEGYYSLLIWSIYTIDLINLTCIAKQFKENKSLLLNLFDHPMIRKDKLHPFAFKRLLEPTKTYDVGTTQLFSFSSIPAEYDDTMIVMPDVLMLLLGRAFSSPSSFTPVNLECKTLPRDHIRVIPGWGLKANKAVFRGSLTSCDVPIESNIRFRAHILSLAFPRHLDVVVNNGYEGLIYYDRSIKVTNVRDFGNSKKRLSPNQQQNDYKYVLELEGFASAWRIVQEMFYSSLILIPDSKFSDVMRSIVKPWVHYVPIKEDLSDLISKIDWCNDHEQEVLLMITQMNCLAHDTVTFENVIRFSGEVFNGKNTSMKPFINTGSEINIEPAGFVFAPNVIPPPNSHGTITETLRNPAVPTPPIVRDVPYYDANPIPPPPAASTAATAASAAPAAAASTSTAAASTTSAATSSAAPITAPKPAASTTTATSLPGKEASTLPLPPPLPEGDIRHDLFLPPPPPLPEPPHRDSVDANTAAVRGLFPEPSPGEAAIDRLTGNIKRSPQPPPLDGGRRRTIAWRRSKPSRYTRRKF